MTRIVVDHALLATLDEGCPSASWHEALARMGFPARLLGSEWPQPLRVFCRERVVPEGADRWALARIGVIAGGAFVFAAAMGLVVVLLPWAEPGQQDRWVYVINGTWTMSWRGGVVLLVLMAGMTGVPLGVQYGLTELGPRNASSEKTRQLALAAKELRERDFLAQHDGLAVLNDASGAWLAALEQVAKRMQSDAENAGGTAAPTRQLKDALGELLAGVSRARSRREAQLKEAEATLRVRDGVVFLPAEFDLEGAVAIVDALARQIEPYPRWLPKLPAR
jgi:hypothetical protein